MQIIFAMLKKIYGDKIVVTMPHKYIIIKIFDRFRGNIVIRFDHSGNNIKELSIGKVSFINDAAKRVFIGIQKSFNENLMMDDVTSYLFEAKIDFKLISVPYEPFTHYHSGLEVGCYRVMVSSTGVCDILDDTLVVKSNITYLDFYNTFKDFKSFTD